MIDYSWVPWLGELVGKIAVAGPDDLAKKARGVDWVTKIRVSDYGDKNVDPFSFIYSLCARAGREKVMQRWATAAKEFSIVTKLPSEPLRFASSQSPLFHKEGEGNPDLLWQLFRTAAAPEAPPLDERLFNDVRGIGNVGVPKLTQALFIINPKRFLPYWTSLPDEQLNRKVDKCNEYKAWMEAVRRMFPGCAPYEVNEFIYAYSEPRRRRGRGLLGASLFGPNTNYFCVDHLPQFDEQNAVWTTSGGPAGRPYPLTKAKRGDVILVAGSRSGIAIGVVEDNGYKNGWQKDARISVYWINKNNARLARDTAQVGFDFADKNSENTKRSATPRHTGTPWP